MKKQTLPIGSVFAAAQVDQKLLCRGDPRYGQDDPAIDFSAGEMKEKGNQKDGSTGEFVEIGVQGSKTAEFHAAMA